MARIKLAYIGGGSTRAPGTMASFIEHGEQFQGSEIVLIDLNMERLGLVKMLAQKMARNKQLDLTIRATTDRRSGLDGCDAVLTSYRPGGFEARYLDESIPLQYGIIGQETQGPSGFFMALRAIHIMRDILADVERVCPNAWLFNYTNPINIISEAITHHSPVKVVSLCEGPIIFPRRIARTAGLDPDKLEAVMIGLNHGSWSVRHEYEGQDAMPLLKEAYEREKLQQTVSVDNFRLLKLAVMMEAIPADYFQYYYFTPEIVEELRKKPTSRAQDILARVPDYWQHYRDQAASDNPVLEIGRSRGGIHELELAIDVMDGVFNDRKQVYPVNVPNHGALSDFPDDQVVEVPGYVDRSGITPLTYGALPKHVVGLVKMLGEYQSLTAEAAWRGNRREGIRALASHPWVLSLELAERIYDQMAGTLREFLPERLLV
jgi:6-phospho-beta-glucosidase